MGKTYRKLVRNKFEKKKLHKLKQKQLFTETEGEEDEQYQDEQKILSKVREENRT